MCGLKEEVYVKLDHKLQSKRKLVFSFPVMLEAKTGSPSWNCHTLVQGLAQK
jgi:hypothetical protein